MLLIELNFNEIQLKGNNKNVDRETKTVSLSPVRFLAKNIQSKSPLSLAVLQITNFGSPFSSLRWALILALLISFISLRNSSTSLKTSKLILLIA